MAKDLIDIEPDYPPCRIEPAISHIGEASRRELQSQITLDQMIDLLALCDEQGIPLRGVIDRAYHKGWDIEAMRADVTQSAEEAETARLVAEIERKFRLAPFREDIDAIMKIWRDEHVPRSYAEQRHFGIQGGAVLAALEESLLAGGKLPRWYTEGREKEAQA